MFSGCLDLKKRSIDHCIDFSWPSLWLEQLHRFQNRARGCKRQRLKSVMGFVCVCEECSVQDKSRVSS